jgi:hypothetical protein
MLPQIGVHLFIAFGVFPGGSSSASPALLCCDDALSSLSEESKKARIVQAVSGQAADDIARKKKQAMAEAAVGTGSRPRSSGSIKRVPNRFRHIADPHPYRGFRASYKVLSFNLLVFLGQLRIDTIGILGLTICPNDLGNLRINSKSTFFAKREPFFDSLIFVGAHFLLVALCVSLLLTTTPNELSQESGWNLAEFRPAHRSPRSPQSAPPHVAGTTRLRSPPQLAASDQWKEFGSCMPASSASSKHESTDLGIPYRFNSVGNRSRAGVGRQRRPR